MPKVTLPRLCLVGGCYNSNRATVNDDDYFYHLPWGIPKRLKAWLNAIGREHYDQMGKGFVCSQHFDADAYPKNHRKILIGSNPPLRLNAVPSINLAEVIALSDDECQILEMTSENSTNKVQKKRRKRRKKEAFKENALIDFQGEQTDLSMECYEETLSLVQLKALKRAKDEHFMADTAVKACLKGCTRTKEDIDLTTGIKTITVYFEKTISPKSVEISGYQMNTNGTDDDVIVVEQPPITIDKSRRSVRLPRNRRGQVPLQPTRILGHIEVLPSITASSHHTMTTPASAKVSTKNSAAPSHAPAGVKRGAAEQVVPPPAKKQKENTKLPIDATEMSWVPLEEYYYGKAEGDPAYTEEKGEFRFKCYCCHKMLYNNLRTMRHIQGHIDSEKQLNLDLSDLTQCKHCYKQFDTPFEMQSHVEKVHQNKSNVLVCRICEKDHDTSGGLSVHMRDLHNPCEMPYICQLCKFRSSVYNDVVDHFYKRHNSSKHMLCLYCLRIFKMNIKASCWGLTQHYFQHLQRHQAKTRAKKCQSCKLSFISQSELVFHRKTDHNKNNRASIGPRFTPQRQQSDQVMIEVGQAMKSLNAPALTKVVDMSQIRMRQVKQDMKCFECKLQMTRRDHYTKHVACSLCRYATTCNDSFARHMTGFHTGNTDVLQRITTREKPSVKMYCLCGYSSCYGNLIANHLTSCVKASCSLKPPVRASIASSPAAASSDVPSLFGALGLVKKSSSTRVPPRATMTQKEASSSEEISQDILDEMLDKVCAVQEEDDVKPEIDTSRRSSVSIMSPIKDRQPSIIGQVAVKEEEPDVESCENHGCDLVEETTFENGDLTQKEGGSGVSERSEVETNHVQSDTRDVSTGDNKSADVCEAF